MNTTIRSFIATALLAAGLSATTIDTSTLNLGFEGYKTKDRIGVEGTFKDIQYKFGKDKNSIKGIFTGANAIISTKNVDMGLDLATKNMRDTFFATFIPDHTIKVEVLRVVEGENTGLITAKVTLNKESRIVPLIYKIDGNKFEATGQLELASLKNGDKALQELSKVVPGHQGLSWPLATITLRANVK